MLKAWHKSEMFYMFKTLKPQKWIIIIIIFKHPFFSTKCVPFFLQIGEDFNIDD
jgi:hypothetical protein